MAKLSQLLTLERMLEAYDNMNFYDAQLANYQAICINGLLDDTIAKLIRQLNSKTPLSCRNVRNYDKDGVLAEMQTVY